MKQIAHIALGAFGFLGCWAIPTAVAAAAPVPGNGWIRVDEPLKQGLDGWIFCNRPDHASKTCGGMEVYERATDGSITATARIPMRNDPPLAIGIVTKVASKEGQTCSKLTASSIASTVLWQGNTKMQGKKAKDLLALLRPALAEAMQDKEICEYHFERGGNYHTIVTIDGEVEEDIPTEYQWLPADSNYTLYSYEPVEGL